MRLVGQIDLAARNFETQFDSGLKVVVTSKLYTKHLGVKKSSIAPQNKHFLHDQSLISEVSSEACLTERVNCSDDFEGLVGRNESKNQLDTTQAVYEHMTEPDQSAAGDQVSQLTSISLKSGKEGPLILRVGQATRINAKAKDTHSVSFGEVGC